MAVWNSLQACIDCCESNGIMNMSGNEAYTEWNTKHNGVPPPPHGGFSTLQAFYEWLFANGTVNPCAE